MPDRNPAILSVDHFRLPLILLALSEFLAIIVSFALSIFLHGKVDSYFVLGGSIIAFFSAAAAYEFSLLSGKTATGSAEINTGTSEIISALGDAVSIQDRNLRVLYQNSRHKALVGDHRGEYCYNAYQLRDSACEDCPVLMSFRDGDIHTLDKKAPEREMHVEITASPLRDSEGRIIAGIEIVRDINRRKRMEQEALWYARNMEKLLLISREITITTDRRQLYRKINSFARDVFKLDFSTIMILTPDRTSLVVKDTIGFPETIMESYGLVEGQGLSTFVIKNRMPDVVPDFSVEKRFSVPSLVNEHGLTSAICAPMMIENEIFGVLIGHTREKRLFLEEEVSLYQTIANHAAVAVKNSMNLKALRESEEKFRSIFETSKDVVYICRGDGILSEINQAGIELFGYSRKDLFSFNVSNLYVNPNDRKPLVRKILENGFVKDYELLMKTKEGRTLNVLVTAVMRKNCQGAVESYTGTIRDISSQKQLENTIRHQAFHDSLTGLPNRLLFNDRLSLAIAQARRNRVKIAILFLDLDRFKSINDSLGHSTGDKILQGVAERLGTSIREGDTIARMGGDEYTILLPGIRQAEDVVGIAGKVLSSFQKPLSVGGPELHISASIGISIYPNDGTDPEILLKNADLAMYHAKDQGRNNYQFYNPAMNVRALERIIMENSLHHALQRGEFVVHYQPKIDLASLKISGVEALIRWNHPELGMLYPTSFMPFAEETGLSAQLDEWVLETSCRQGRSWLDQGLKPIGIAVNLSARQIQQPALIKTISNLLDSTGFIPGLLELEITENIAMQNVDETVGKLRTLNGMGVVLSIDDFGSGYSSLAYLKKLPIQTIKIDKSFIIEVTESPDDAAIVSAVIAMCKSLKIKVVAEGVEHRNQLDFLVSKGCDEIQGFLFGRPSPAGEISRILAQESAGTGNPGN